ncbi:MAG: heterodisulfide reductase-related iron-sulfur binding cluster [Chloroflexota bacterium]
MLPGREDFWNIGFPLVGIFVYVVLAVAGISIAYGFYRRYRFWRLGQPVHDLGPWRPRIRRFLALASADILLHRRFVRKNLYPGIMHLCLFWGAVILFIATSVSAVEDNLNKFFDIVFITRSYRVQASLIWDIGGVLMAIGVIMAMYRRYIIRPPNRYNHIDDLVILGIILALVVTGFAIEGLRIGATDLNAQSELYSFGDALWSPIGFLFAKLFIGMGMSPGAMEVSHKAMWWSHVAIVAFAFIYAAVSFTKLTHIVVGPATALLSSNRPKGALRPMPDLESMESYGARDVNDFTWKQLLSFDACTNCGRCRDQCPARASDKSLSPRKLIRGLKGYMEQRAPILLNLKNGEQPSPPETPMVQDVGEEALWSCTTCRACMEVCPAFIEHIDIIVDMRRYLVMEEARLPETAMNALQSMETRGHPWRGARATRIDWAEGMSIKTMAEDSDVDILFWVGCTPALEERGQKMARAMASVLKMAGVNFGILGMEETCTGDPARRLGNEYLYLTLAQQTIGTLNRYNVKKIVTICPHCFNTIKNEYPQLGGHYEVVHYTQFVNELIQQGRIKPLRAIETTLAYHDSCYLGRHNGVYNEPREIAQAIPGIQLVEMYKCLEQSFCCGAGGGRMWMDEPGTRVSDIRTEQFLKTGADTLGVSCPFCIQQLEAGIQSKGVQDTRQVKDLLELLVESAAPEEPDISDSSR